MAPVILLRLRKKADLQSNLSAQLSMEARKDLGPVSLQAFPGGVPNSMPHIALPESQPGIRGAMAFRPETARPLNDLVEVLLRAPNSLSSGERELIAT